MSIVSIQVRRAEDRDIPKIINLLTQVCNVHHSGRPDIFKSDSQKYTRGQLEVLLRDETRPVFVGAGADGEVLGYGFCIVTETRDNNVLCDMKTLYIDDLCVDEAARGKGVGRAIYDFIVDYAKEIGCYHLTLNVWACNPAAMAFYEARGLKMLKKEMEVIL